MKLAPTTPRASATTTRGTASMAYLRWSAGCSVTSSTSTATCALASTAALPAIAAHDWQVAEVKTATRYGASGRQKSDRSSWSGAR